MPGVIRWERARAVIRVLNEMRELGQATDAARHHLLTSLFRIVGAVIGTTVLDANYRLGATDSLKAYTLAGFDETSVALFDDHRRQGAWVNPVHAYQISRVIDAGGELLAASEVDVMTRRAWARAPWVAEQARPARFDHFLMTGRVLETKHHIEGIALMRAVGDSPFSDEDRDVVHLAHLECGRLFVQPEHERVVLAPRVRATLEALLTGASDKEIAQELAISPHTVREYVKRLFRTFGVTSRGQLIAQVLSRRAAVHDRQRPASV